MRKWALLFLLALFLLPAASLGQSEKPLTNDDILQMIEAGFDEETIIKAIAASETHFDTSVTALVALKRAGVSEKIIAAMLDVEARKRNPAPAANPAPPENPAPAPSPWPEEIGVYVKVGEEWKEVESEVVTWRQGGLMKSALIGTRGHINGNVRGPSSELRVGQPVEFLIRTPEGTSASEYQLLKLWDKKDRREFRAMTGGFMRAKGGADMNLVEVDYQRAASRTYRVVIDRQNAGEYGFLPPGAIAAANTASVGKIYTFRILE